MEDHDEAARFRLQHRNRTGVALDVEGKMKTPSKATPPKRARHLVNGPVHHAPHGHPAGVGANGEAYAVPDEVYAFLSRGEQAKLKAQRR